MDETRRPVTVGAILHEWRQERNVSIEEVAARTRVRHELLRNLEDNNFEVLPAAVYVAGYITSYARALGFDPAAALECYSAQTRVPGVEYIPGTNTPVGYDRRPSLRSVGMLIGTFIVVVVAVNIFVRNYKSTSQVDPIQTPASTAPVATPIQSVIPPFRLRDSDAVLNVDDLRFRLMAEMNVSVQVFIDGEPRYTGFMNPGESFEWFAKDSVGLIVDNAGGVRVEIDGTFAGQLGGIGKRVEREWKKSDETK